MSVEVGHSAEQKVELSDRFHESFDVVLVFESESAASEDWRYVGTAFRLCEKILDSETIPPLFKELLQSRKINKVFVHCRVEPRRRCLVLRSDVHALDIYRSDRTKLLDLDFLEAYLKKMIRDLTLVG